MRTRMYFKTKIYFLRRHAAVFYYKSLRIQFQEDDKFAENDLLDSDLHPHLCNICDEQFTTVTELHQHSISAHADKKVHSCHQCDRSFDRLYYLKLHKKMFHSNICKECDNSFTTPSDLQAHLLTHTAPNLHACNQCDESFDQSSNLEMHKKLAHEGHLSKSVCFECGIIFTTPDNLRAHLLTHSGEKSFKQFATLAMQKNTIQPVKNIQADSHVCKICRKRFQRSSELIGHMMSAHTYACDQCSRVFSCQSLLSNHKLIGHHLKKCDNCFTNPISLKRSSSYSGKRPYACDLCGQCFKYLSNLRIHKKRIHKTI